MQTHINMLEENKLFCFLVQNYFERNGNFSGIEKTFLIETLHPIADEYGVSVLELCNACLNPCQKKAESIKYDSSKLVKLNEKHKLLLTYVLLSDDCKCSDTGLPFGVMISQKLASKLIIKNVGKLKFPELVNYFKDDLKCVTPDYFHYSGLSAEEYECLQKEVKGFIEVVYTTIAKAGVASLSVLPTLGISGNLRFLELYRVLLCIAEEVGITYAQLMHFLGIAVSDQLSLYNTLGHCMLLFGDQVIRIAEETTRMTFSDYIIQLQGDTAVEKMGAFN